MFDALSDIFTPRRGFAGADDYKQNQPQQMDPMMALGMGMVLGRTPSEGTLISQQILRQQQMQEQQAERQKLARMMSEGASQAELAQAGFASGDIGLSDYLGMMSPGESEMQFSSLPAGVRAIAMEIPGFDYSNPEHVARANQIYEQRMLAQRAAGKSSTSVNVNNQPVGKWSDDGKIFTPYETDPVTGEVKPGRPRQIYGRAELESGYKKKMQQIDDFESSLLDLENAVSKHGKQWLVGKGKGELSTTYNLGLMNMKDFYGLGSPQEGELELMSQIIQNPRALSTLSKDQIISQIRHVRGVAGTARKNFQRSELTPERFSEIHDPRKNVGMETPEDLKFPKGEDEPVPGSAYETDSGMWEMDENGNSKFRLK